MNQYKKLLNNYSKFDKIYFQQFFDINYYSINNFNWNCHKNNFISWLKISYSGKLYDKFVDKFADKIYFVILQRHQVPSSYIYNKYRNKFYF